MRLLHECLNRRFYRIGLLVFLDVAIVAASYFTALWLRVDLLEGRAETIFNNAYFFATLPSLLAIRIFFNFLFKLYHWSFSHAGLTEGARLTTSLFTGTIAFVVVGHVLQLLPYPPPRSIYVLEASISFFGMFVLRFLPGYLLLVSAQRLQMNALNNNEALRTVIYGDSDSTAMLAKELLRTHGHHCAIIGLIDDNPAHLNMTVYGVKVLGTIRDLVPVIKENQVEQVLLVGNDVPGETMRFIVDACGPFRVRLKSVPKHHGLLAPRFIKDIDPEMLLDRQPVRFDMVDMKGFFRGKTVLITGAGGTIGSELCRQVGGHEVARLLLLDIDENALFFLEAELRDLFPISEIVLLLGSIRDRSRLDSIMEQYRPDIVFHAAAHKHVPILESAPGEAVKNNVLGTFEVADSALAHGVSRFVLISTDKVASGANILGLSKRLAELMVKSMNVRGGTRFQIVRFGNVLDSNGSLVDIIRRQIAKGGPVTVTHPEMKRYFMTIQEAVGLVLVAAVIGEGEVNILDMGSPTRVDTLVRQMIYLAGFVPDQDMEIRYTTPRPGEVFQEELFMVGETIRKASFPRINIAYSEDTIDVKAVIEEARKVGEMESSEATRMFLQKGADKA